MKSLLIVSIAVLLCSGCERATAITTATPSPALDGARLSASQGTCTRTQPPSSLGTTNTGTFAIFNSSCSTAYVYSNGSPSNVRTIAPQTFTTAQAYRGGATYICVMATFQPTGSGGSCFQGPPDIDPATGTRGVFQIPLEIYSAPAPSTYKSEVTRKIQAAEKFRVRSPRGTNSDALGVRG
jgi:hypothetical protein